MTFFFQVFIDHMRENTDHWPKEAEIKHSSKSNLELSSMVQRTISNRWRDNKRVKFTAGPYFVAGSLFQRYPLLQTLYLLSGVRAFRNFQNFTRRHNIVISFLPLFISSLTMICKCLMGNVFTWNHAVWDHEGRFRKWAHRRPGQWSFNSWRTRGHWVGTKFF